MKDETSIEEQFINSTKGLLTGDPADKSKSLVVRGVIKKDHMYACKEDGRDFYYIDTGYIGNFPSIGNPSGKKIWHRVVKNNLQHDITKDVPQDRWNNLIKQDARLKWTKWKNYDKKILLVIPNPKACKFYNIDCDTWIEETKEKIKKNIDLPIEIRIKGSRSYRNHEYSIYDAFDSGVYATVAFNSIAALESVLYGIPAFVSVPCAASPLANSDLEFLQKPFKPDLDLIKRHCYTLAYGQFTLEEISNGTAFDLVEKYS